MAGPTTSILKATYEAEKRKAQLERAAAQGRAAGKGSSGKGVAAARSLLRTAGYATSSYQRASASPRYARRPQTARYRPRRRVRRVRYSRAPVRESSPFDAF